MSVILSNKSDDEIRWMLDDYGIKHGPVVDTTRHLYEKKLREAMANEKRARLRPRPPPPERSFHREEEEDFTYERHQPQYRDEDFYRGQWRHREMDDVDDYRPQATYRYTSQSAAAPSRWGNPGPETAAVPEEKDSSSWVPLWLRLLVFVLVAAALVLIFANMEAAETEPFKRLN